METKAKLNQLWQKGFISYTKKEKGITLVALIITVIILVLLAAIGISIIYNSRLIEHAINGTQNYAIEGINENKVIEGTENTIESAVDNLNKIGEDTGSESPLPTEERYKVKFYEYNNTEASKEVVKEMELPSISDIEIEGVVYTARGWSTREEVDAEVNKEGTKVKVEADTTYYASYEAKTPITILYNSNDKEGQLTVANTTALGKKLINYKGEKGEELIIPEEVTNSVGKYNSKYRGVSSELNSANITTSLTSEATYYAVYSMPVNIYHPITINKASNCTKYRNEYFTSNTELTAKIGDSVTSTRNFDYNSLVNKYSLYGFGVSENTTSRTYSSVETLATSNTNTIYTILYRASGSNTYYTYCTGDETATCTEPMGIVAEELSKTDYIGKYVGYKSVGKDYTVDGTYSGTGSNQTFAKNDNMKWRIWGVEGNKLLLISEVVAGDIRLQGANGYNNGVKILNDACSTAFGNSSYGSAIKARSINQDDIDKVTNMTEESQRKAVNSNYGVSYSPNNGVNWPNIYGQEKDKSGGGTLDRSGQNSWITGNTRAYFTGKYTYYKYDITNYATQAMYDTLITNPTSNSTIGSDMGSVGYYYWIASRCVTMNSVRAEFRMFRMVNGRVDAEWLYDARTQVHGWTCASRPMIEINLDEVKIGLTGTGTNTSPYSMALR